MDQELLSIEYVSPKKEFTSSLGQAYKSGSLYLCFIDSDSDWYCIQDTLRKNYFEWFKKDLFEEYFTMVKHYA